MKTLKVALGERSYPIHIGAGLIARAGEILGPILPSRRAIIITDDRVGPLYLKPLEASLTEAGFSLLALVIPAGEESKNFSEFQRLLGDVLDSNPDRRTALIALGGGVIGDLTGFAASVLLRGVPFVQIPTTLLAQVDSAVGGKTAINTQHGKNLVGSFYQPHAVLADTDTLKTLPPREFRAGYAELIKYGLIADAAFFTAMEKLNGLLTGDALVDAIYRACEIKADIVGQDEKESGVRALLNFGHTFAHAFEVEAGYGSGLLHGEAVAFGMVMAAELSESLGFIASDVTARIIKHFSAAGLPITPPAGEWKTDALVKRMHRDKKAEDGKMTFILLHALGQAAIHKDVMETSVRRVLEKHLA